MKYELITEIPGKAYFKFDKPIQFDARGIEVEEPSKYVVISDAHTHEERLVFLFKLIGNCTEKDIVNQTKGCIKVNYSDIDGEITMMIQGGDITSVKPYEYYLDRLVKANKKLVKATNLIHESK